MNLDFKVLRKKKLDKELSLTIYKNEYSDRIFVEFVSKDKSMLLQKNFQDSFHGRQEAEKFEKSISSTEELRAYLFKKK